MRACMVGASVCGGLGSLLGLPTLAARKVDLQSPNNLEGVQAVDRIEVMRRWRVGTYMAEKLTRRVSAAFI